MKNVRRILSLVLAVMLVMSVFVLPAFAAKGDTYTCPSCGKKVSTHILKQQVCFLNLQLWMDRVQLWMEPIRILILE